MSGLSAKDFQWEIGPPFHAIQEGVRVMKAVAYASGKLHFQVATKGIGICWFTLNQEQTAEFLSWLERVQGTEAWPIEPEQPSQ